MSAASDTPLIEGEHLTVRAGARTLIEDVSAKVHKGEIVTLVGLNGSGKTTLVKCLLGLLRPVSGTVRRQPGLRIGYTPQHIARDPTLPLTVGRFLGLGRRTDSAARRRALEEVGAPDLMEAPLADISGGELHRVTLARSLLREPHLLVLDEPLANVDLAGQAELYSLIGRLRRERGVGVLLVSHELHLVMASSDRVICLHRRVTCEGVPAAVVSDRAFAGVFGETIARQLALYAHDHDTHDGVQPPHDHGAGSGAQRP